MNIEQFREYCINKKGVTEGFPFNKTTLVFKVMNKMFTLASIENFTSCNLKCNPETALELREKHESVKPGFHMSKKHWNTVNVNQDMDTLELCKWIDNSYNLVVSGLTKKLKEELNNL